MIRRITSKDENNFISYCQRRDTYSDFYITKDRKRLFLNNTLNAKTAFNDALKHGNKAFIFEEGGEIKGLFLVVGYKDDFNRKYVKFFVDNKKVFADLCKFLKWQNLKNLHIKVKIDNDYFIDKLRDAKFRPTYPLYRNRFEIKAIYDNEVLLKQK